MFLSEILIKLKFKKNLRDFQYTMPHTVYGATKIRPNHQGIYPTRIGLNNNIIIPSVSVFEIISGWNV